MARVVYSWIPVKERGLVKGINFSGSRIGAALAMPGIAWLIKQYGCSLERRGDSVLVARQPGQKNSGALMSPQKLKGVCIGAGCFSHFQYEAWRRLFPRLRTQRPGYDHALRRRRCETGHRRRDR